jgi:hypothetical protein
MGAMLFIFLILAAIVLAQPSPPAQGIQLGSGLDVRFPLTVTQCEPVLIFLDVVGQLRGESGDAYLFLSTPDHSSTLITFNDPSVPSGYFEWICNIPAGYGFWAYFDSLTATTYMPSYPLAT